MIWTIIALLIAGLLLLVLEILTPSFGILVGMAILALAAASWLTYQENAVVGVIMMVVLFVLVPAYLIAVVKYLPKSRLGRRLVLGETRHDRGEGMPEAAQDLSLVGKTGTAETTLRPSGAVRIEGRRVHASAEAGLIEKGAAVKVIRATGANIVVRRAEEA